MNESLQIRKAGNMISTSVLSRIDPVDFVDTFCCRITAERDIRPADVLITMFTNYPQWVEALMKLRNCLVEPFGLKGGKDNIRFRNCSSGYDKGGSGIYGG